MNEDLDRILKADQPFPDRANGIDSKHNLDLTLEEEVVRLAGLNPLEYAQQRAILAKKYKIGLKFLDKAVEVVRPKTDTNQHLQGEEISFPEITPWEHPVDGVALLDGLLQFLQRYLVLPPGGSVTAALWIIFTYARDLFGISPRLVASSPEKRCGKSTFLEVLSLLVLCPLLSSNVTPAALFRTIQRHYPTLLIDEIDSFQEAHEELRGLINSGHTRRLAQVIRNVGENHEPRVFSTWCTMVLALIGRLPDTIEDRSLIVNMQRKKPSERVDRFPRTGLQLEAIQGEAEQLQQQIMRLVNDHHEALLQAKPTPLPELSDRANDNWYPLLAIADVIGGPWPEQAQKAALLISGKKEDGQRIGIQLLIDIAEIFALEGSDRIGSKDLCEKLEGLEERPWATWKRGKPISPNNLAKFLNPFGVSSRTIRTDTERVKGYLKEDFEEAWERYCHLSQEVSPLNGDTVTSPVNTGEDPVF